MSSDEDLVRAVLAGELDYFAVLMRRHNQRLFRLLRSIVRQDAEAEDAVQQTYVSAYRHLRDLDAGASFASWIGRIAFREGLTRLRRRGRRREVDLQETHLAPVDDRRHRSTPESELERRELGALLEAAIDALPAIYRVVFVMREVQQLSTAETAMALSLSQEAVKVRLHRGRQLLRGHLDVDATEAYRFLGERCDRIVATVMAELCGSAAVSARSAS